MKNYKDFEKIYIGDSDIACLVLAGGKDGVGATTQILNFNEDNCYYAYYVDEPATIGEHYTKIASFTSWLKIYDDTELTFKEDGNFTIYRAGSLGCIIQKNN